MSGFADTTSVSPEKTRAEIETLIAKYKADSFMSGWGQGEAFVAFRAQNRLVKFVIKMPDPKDKQFTHKNSYIRRSDGDATRHYEQAVRTIWRRLLLCIKAKLESVASGIETFETAFMAHIVIPDGRTVGEWLGPQLAAAAASGTLPKSLPARRETPTGPEPEKEPPRTVIVIPPPTPPPAAGT